MPSGISPLVSLATSMHAQPGVYGLLLGSGVSTGAGIPTGWGVVTELVARIAALQDGPHGAADARRDPGDWWRRNGEGELGYSTLLEQLAPTPAARQGLLAEFFEGENRDGDSLVPSRAHHAIAQLVERGSVRVIITTNFDRLMEQALEAAGISPQVISRPEAVNGMMPLAHAAATVIKLHGDYKDLGTRNTPSELADYPQEWATLLSQVFEEYGLIVSGWSAEWDDALVGALETARYRYPLFWDSRSARKENAQRLLASRAGGLLPAASADALFTDLAENLDALARMSAAPVTRAIAVARLKRYLLDPTRRIDLHDLVMNAVDDVVAGIRNQPVVGVAAADLQQVWEERIQSMGTLASLLVEGVWHDLEGTHDLLWADVVQRLADAAAVHERSYIEAHRGARRIPALIALQAISMAATKRGREALFPRLVRRVQILDRNRDTEPENVAEFVHYGLIGEESSVTQMPRNDGKNYSFPISHLLHVDTRPLFADFAPEDADFTIAFFGFEYRLGLLQRFSRGYSAISGEYLGRREWGMREHAAEKQFRRDIAKHGEDGWAELLTSDGKTVDAALVEHRDHLKQVRAYSG